MLQQLRSRESGTLGGGKTPVLFETIESDRRLTSLDLAKFKDFESVHRTPVVCGNIDPTECRYFISGSVDGTLAIHDLEDPVHVNGDVVTTYKAVAIVNKRNKPDIAHRFSVETASWYPFDTGMCLSSGGDKLLKIWDTNSMTPVDDFEFGAGVNDHDMSSVARQRCLVAVATESPRIKLVDLKSGAASHVLRGHESSVLSVHWSPKEEFKLVSGSRDRRILVWDVRRVKSVLACLDMSQRDRAELKFSSSSSPFSFSSSTFAHRGSVKCVQFTSDGNHLLSYGADGCLRLWDASTWRLHEASYDEVEDGGGALDRKSCLAISDAGLRSVVFCPTQDDINVFDLYTGFNLSNCGEEALKGHFQRVNFVALHPWLHELYSGANDRNLVVWTYAKGARDVAYEEHLEEETRRRKGEGVNGRCSTLRAYRDSWSDDSDDESSVMKTKGY